MVTAILDGRKTQTRRIVKIPDLIKEPDRYHYVGNSNDFDIPRKAIPYDDRLYHAWRLNNNNMPMWVDHCPYGKIGDVLWVRETWNKRKDILSGIEIYIHKEKHVRFKRPSATEWKWKPSIFMPKEACRITLEITNIRVERLQHISWEDALSEGIDTFQGQSDNCYDYLTGKYAWSNPVNSYMTLWEKINGSGSVAINPWVWVIEFKVKEVLK
jgi:hypothetical protein